MSGFPQVFPNMDEAYRHTVTRVLEKGEDRQDRTGIGTRSVFGHSFELSLSEGTIPVLSLKKTGYRDAIAELIWMLSGSNSIVPLLEQDIHIWTDWPLKAFNEATGENINRDEFEARVLGDSGFAMKWGIVSPCYGTEMRHYQSADGRVIDQMGQLIEAIKAEPTSRRLHWSLWRPEYVTVKGGSGLPPCHNRGTVRVSSNGTLSVKLSLRSSDVGLGLPFNTNQYGYFVHLLALLTGNRPGNLIIDLDDAHIYSNHIDPLQQVLSRHSRPDPHFKWKRKPSSIDDNLSVDDVEIIGYQPQGFIKLPVAV